MYIALILETPIWFISYKKRKLLETSKSENMPQHWYAKHGMKIEINGKLKLATICSRV